MAATKQTHGIHTAAGYGGLSVTARVMITVGAGSVVLAAVLFFIGRSYSGSLARELQQRAVVEGMPLAARKPAFERKGDSTRVGEDKVVVTRVELGPESRPATLYEYQLMDYLGEPERVIVPATVEDAESAFTSFWLLVSLALLGGGLVLGFVVSEQVKVPINRIAERIRQMSGEGDKPRAGAKAESVEVLAHSVGRVSRQLSQAREVEQELGVRQREFDLAAGVREALLPQRTPTRAGWRIAASHLSSERFGGDFHDFIEPDEQRLGVLVCDVSGQGVPAAMVGAAARSYLRSELLRGEDLGDALKRVNHELGRDVRRGMYVSALYVLIDAASGRARVACAGHKVPLLRIAAADGKLRSIQPEGIALGLDKGPVFDRTLKVVQTEIERGDRLLLCSTGPLRMPDPAGKEFGEKAFYAEAVRASAKPPEAWLDALRDTLAKHAAVERLPLEASLVAIARDPA